MRRLGFGVLVLALAAVTLAGCLPPPPADPVLTVHFIGGGAGTVRSYPAGINGCTSTCSASYTSGLTVVLEATAAPGSLLGGMDGDCISLSVCYVHVAGNTTVDVVFVAAPVKFANQWGTTGSGAGQFSGPSGVATDSAGNVYVTDSGNNRVEKFSRTGALLTTWGGFGAATGQFNNPIGIAVDASDHVLVADNGNGRVQEFAADGTYVGSFAAYAAYALAVDAAGAIYVTDHANDSCKVWKHAPTGEVLSSFGGGCGGTIGAFLYPVGITIDSAGNIYVVDDYGERVQKFDSAGHYLDWWGGHASGLGTMNYPSGIAVDGADHLFVADLDIGVQVFNSSGDVLAAWRGPSASPFAIAIGPFGDVYAVDRVHNQVQRFTA